MLQFTCHPQMFALFRAVNYGTVEFLSSSAHGYTHSGSNGHGQSSTGFPPPLAFSYTLIDTHKLNGVGRTRTT